MVKIAVANFGQVVMIEKSDSDIFVSKAQRTKGDEKGSAQ